MLPSPMVCTDTLAEVSPTRRGNSEQIPWIE